MSPIVPLPPSFSVGVQTAELSSVATRECVAYIPEREVPWGGLRWRWAAGNLAPGAGTGDVIDHLCGSRPRRLLGSVGCSGRCCVHSGRSAEPGRPAERL